GISSPSNPMRGSVLVRAVFPGQHRAPERSAQLRGPDPGFRRQAFLAGTAVGSAGFAVRARLTRGVLTDALAFAGLLVRAAVVLLRGARLAGVGSSAAASTVSLALSAAWAVFFSALSATLVALAAVFCAIEVTSLEAS